MHFATNVVAPIQVVGGNSGRVLFSMPIRLQESSDLRPLPQSAWAWAIPATWVATGSYVGSQGNTAMAEPVWLGVACQAGLHYEIWEYC